MKENGGACIVKTSKLILIGTFNIQNKMANNVPQNPGELNKRIESLAANLRKSGY